MKLIYLFLFLLSFSFSRAQWLKEKGKGYYKLGTWSLLADQHFTDIGGVDPNATRGLFISSFLDITVFQRRSTSLLMFLFS